jgi:hypothetical protein
MGHPSLVRKPGQTAPQASVRWCGVFQVVKTAQSRERAGRSLLTAFSMSHFRLLHVNHHADKR